MELHFQQIVNLYTGLGAQNVVSRQPSGSNGPRRPSTADPPAFVSASCAQRITMNVFDSSTSATQKSSRLTFFFGPHLSLRTNRRGRSLCSAKWWFVTFWSTLLGCCTLAGLIPAGTALQVDTTLGKIESRQVTVQIGQRSVTVEEFLGIPYAKPPVNSLRFAPPQLADSWAPRILYVTMGVAIFTRL
ncbi:unnamed protein product [Protopolystoma xenopodis]|uniref:Carboxylesterase type B domain-containing protein n=1 Tax=Protopolystoma xenopodis TaxID=117903 RepID=A0A3S5AS06_9PLAT|nr:unnamed protein product [Protopolystoma xenopodis]